MSRLRICLLGLVFTTLGLTLGAAEPAKDLALELGQVKLSLMVQGKWSAANVRLPMLRFGLAGMGPRTFNPAFAKDPQSRLVCALLSTSLKQAAEKITWQARAQGGARLEITIKPDLKWSDGSDVAASDWVDAVREIYANPEIDSVYQSLLGSKGNLQWSAPNTRTVRIDSTRLLEQSEMEEFCAIAPQPMKVLRVWRQLGQAGSLGTGSRAPADDAFFDFVDFTAPRIITCGVWLVSEYRPGISLDLKNPANNQSLRFIFFESARDIQNAFAQGKLDILTSLGSMPDSVVKWPPKAIALGYSPQIVCLLINPALRSYLSWLPGFVAHQLNRGELLRGLRENVALPVNRIWGMDFAAPTGQAPKGKTVLQILYDSSQADRKTVALAIDFSDKDTQTELRAEPVASNLANMSALLAFGGNWRGMVVSVDESQNPGFLWSCLHIGPGNSPNTANFQSIIPLYRPVALLWAHQNLEMLPPDIEKSFLAYASELH